MSTIWDKIRIGGAEPPQPPRQAAPATPPQEGNTTFSTVPHALTYGA